MANNQKERRIRGEISMGEDVVLQAGVTGNDFHFSKGRDTIYVRPKAEHLWEVDRPGDDLMDVDTNLMHNHFLNNKRTWTSADTPRGEIHRLRGSHPGPFDVELADKIRFSLSHHGDQAVAECSPVGLDTMRMNLGSDQDRRSASIGISSAGTMDIRQTTLMPETSQREVLTVAVLQNPMRLVVDRARNLDLGTLPGNDLQSEAERYAANLARPSLHTRLEIPLDGGDMVAGAHHLDETDRSFRKDMYWVRERGTRTFKEGKHESTVLRRFMWQDPETNQTKSGEMKPQTSSEPFDTLFKVASTDERSCQITPRVSTLGISIGVNSQSVSVATPRGIGTINYSRGSITFGSGAELMSMEQDVGL